MSTPSCATCHQSPPTITLKSCSQCKSTQYCSRDCQKADWKSHKRSCGGKQSHPPSSSSSPSPSPSPGLTRSITTPFTHLSNKTYLHSLPEQDVYTLLIDAYRLRVTDTGNFDGPGVVRQEIFNGNSASSDPLVGLGHFLDNAQAQGDRGILPPWWDASKRAVCERLAKGEEWEIGTEEGRRWLDLRRRGSLDKGDIIARYGNPQFPMQLRMLAETVYGRGVGGMSGAGMMGMMASMEGGGDGGMEDMMASMLDLRSGKLSSVR